MGKILYCDTNNIFHISYNDWKQIKICLAYISIKYIHLFIQNNTNNTIICDDFKNIVSNFIEQINNNHNVSLHDIYTFYKNFSQTITFLNLQGIYSFFDDQLTSYTYDTSIHIINIIDVLYPIFCDDIAMNNIISGIRNIHYYSVENKKPLFIN